jgi:hypothetical protein
MEFFHFVVIIIKDPFGKKRLPEKFVGFLNGRDSDGLACFKLQSV